MHLQPACYLKSEGLLLTKLNFTKCQQHDLVKFVPKHKYKK